MSVKVYGSATGTAFHSTRACYTIAKSKVTRLKVIGSRTPCLVCYPDYPQIDVIHRLCTRCGHTRINPCAHNGAVAVLVPNSNGADRRRWVWPEQAFRYEVAPPAVRV